MPAPASPAMSRAGAAVGNLADAQRKALESVADSDVCDFPRRNLNRLFYEYTGATREPLLADDRGYYRERLRSGIRAYRMLVTDGYRPKGGVVTVEIRRAA